MAALNFGLTMHKTDEGFEISGQTFHSRDKLKALGGKWNAEKKVWILPLTADLSSLVAVQQPAPPISEAMRQQMADYYISDAYLRRVIGRSRHGRCCSAAKTEFDEYNPQGPMWYVCDKHGRYKSDYDGT